MGKWRSHEISYAISMSVCVSMCVSMCVYVREWVWFLIVASRSFVRRTDTISPFAKSLQRKVLVDFMFWMNVPAVIIRIYTSRVHVRVLCRYVCVCACAKVYTFRNNNNHWSNALRLLIRIWVEVDILLDYGKALGSIVILYLLRLYYQWGDRRHRLKLWRLHEKAMRW